MSQRRALFDVAKEQPYAASGAMVLIVTGVGFVTEPILHAANLDMLYLAVVFISALFCGERPALLTAVVGAVVFNFCFVPPRFSWAVTDLAYFVTLLVFVVVAVVTARLATQARQRLLDHAARETAEALSASKDEILHKISHELRSPMSAVLGWTQLLRLSDRTDEDIAAALTGLENSAQLLRRLIEDLLEASRATSGKLPVHLQPMMLGPIVAKALDVVSVAAEKKGITIDRSIQDARALADELRIEQVVTNLVTNAIKFTPSGGRIAVSLRSEKTEALLQVSDTGSGIAAEFLPHVFDPFSQADPANSHGGLGLGLSIVKHLVAAHGGSIHVESDGPGRGAAFIVTLPLLPVDTPAAQHIGAVA